MAKRAGHSTTSVRANRVVKKRLQDKVQELLADIVGTVDRYVAIVDADVLDAGKAGAAVGRLAAASGRILNLALRLDLMDETGGVLSEVMGCAIGFVWDYLALLEELTTSLDVTA